MIIQALVAKATVEAFNVCVLRRLTPFNQLELDAILIRPLIQRRLASGTVIPPNFARQV